MNTAAAFVFLDNFCIQYTNRFVCQGLFLLFCLVWFFKIKGCNVGAAPWMIENFAL